MDPNLSIAIFWAIGIAMLFLGLDLMITWRQLTLRKRLNVYRPADDKDGDAGKDGNLSTGTAGARSQNPLLMELARAGLPVTPGEFLTATALLGLLGAILAFALFQHLVGILIGGLLGLYVPRLYLRYMQYRRLDAFCGQLESMLVLVSNTLRAGYGLGQAIEMVAKEMPPPISVEFERVAREVALGISQRAALANLLTRNPSDDLDLIITAININHEVGGNLTEVLDRIGGTIRERVRLAGEIKTITSMQRFSAQILFAMPLVLVGLLFLMNPEYVALLWTRTCGFVMLGVWGLFTVAGFLVIRKLLKFRY